MEVSGQLHALATLPLDKELQVHGWAPKASLDILEKRKSNAPARIQTLDNPAHSVGIILTMLSWLPSNGKAEIKFFLYTKAWGFGDTAAQILNVSTGWR
jgi:hypothetical protein